MLKYNIGGIAATIQPLVYDVLTGHILLLQSAGAIHRNDPHWGCYYRSWSGRGHQHSARNIQK